MTSADLLLPVVLGVVVLVLLACLALAVLALRRERVGARAELEATRAEAAQLRERVDALARSVQPRHAPDEFVITAVGDPTASDEPVSEPQRIEGRLFADLVLRESVVKAAALTHGVRRALAPESRNRIRFQMKQEIKRSRKQRRIEIRDVRREMAARQRSQEGAA
ncbi:hypothetical protein [Nocardioides sp. Soil796]|uniref:hypothetical protein n=1 Tax=Nocardioides sp. Soil796 TaxID=1736412 RepID=UPI00070F1E54|nr:hypothetical protein [Nocardioides sp. Soil796]KRF16246.1 hypothetical protein ASH02_06605 [Nocardioides sp. Soil796]